MILDRFRIDGRVALVTGAGRGLGAAIAEGFAEAGADVVISARSKDELDEVAARVEATGRKARVVVADLSDPEAAQELSSTAQHELGRLDICVNNVGGAAPNGLLDTTVEEMEKAFRFNVSNAHALTTAATPIMRETGEGSIINMSSAMGRLPGRGFATYGTAKAALAHYTKLAALDLNPHIRVNGIAPGAVHTSSLDAVAADDELRRPMEEATPQRRLGQPEDIASAALFLASDAGSFMTGKVLEMDGGLIKPNFELPTPDL